MKTVTGTIRGRTIELADDLGLQDGQEVRVQVTPVPPRTEPWGEGIRRSAGCMPDDPDFDAVMQEIYLERKRERREPPEEDA
jgi:hypothetical protein